MSLKSFLSDDAEMTSADKSLHKQRRKKRDGKPLLVETNVQSAYEMKLIV